MARSTRSTQPCRTSLPAAWRARPKFQGDCCALFRREPYTAEESTLNSDLTHREYELLDLVGRDFSNKEIGSELCLSVATVKYHVHHVLEKLSVQSR
jgi:ATP/maltotriose-dependent transcriptional regulator MalT